MSVSSVSSTTSSLTEGLENWASMMKKVQSEFKQLGQDLQSGDVSQAESDYTTLTQYLSDFSSNSTSSISSAASTESGSTSLVDELNTLGQDLQSGDLSAAQSDYTTLQNDLEQASNQAPPPPPPPNFSNTQASDSTTSTSSSTLLEELNALGDALSSSDLTSAQTAYATLQQDLLQFGLTGTAVQQGTGQVSTAS